MLKRNRLCGTLRAADAGEEVVLSGWVNKSRNLGGLLFIDLRDRSGIAQLFVNPEESPEVASIAGRLHEEWVITVGGRVIERPESMRNADMTTGDVEVQLSSITVENEAEPMPFNLDDPLVNEDTRLQFRYLEMRRSAVGDHLRLRHRVTKTIRDYFDDHSFCEIETPILSKSTPEGARDYLVPSRVQSGKFYALPQAPQQYKQLLMAGGMERYFQIAKCFRDEDLRADRQPEFTQVDVEMSFVDQNDIMTTIEGLLARIMAETLDVEITTPFHRLTYHDAMNRFGSDKPDLRFALELEDVGHCFSESEFKVFKGTLDKGGVIKAINGKGLAGKTRREIDGYTDVVKEIGAKGLAWLKIEANQECSGQVAKFLSDAEKQALLDAMQAQEGDLILLVADDIKIANPALGRLRNFIAQSENMIAADTYEFAWVTEFPLLDYDPEEDRYVAMHHPFTSPMAEDVERLENEPSNARAQAYDVVLNGVELGGGSIRIHQPELQRRMFKALGIDNEEANLRFGHLLRAFALGAPPHGGIALGLDRLIMILSGANSIREVIAFPKTARAGCLMTGSPADVDARQLDDLNIAVTVEDKATAESEA